MPAEHAQFAFVIQAFVAGLFASITCGLGALPLLIKRIDPLAHIGLSYCFAGGLMFAASVYNLLLPAFTLGTEQAFAVVPVLKTIGGLLAGCGFIWWVESYLTEERLQSSPLLKLLGNRMGVLIFVAMTFHSIPEGVAVGVAFASGEHYQELSKFGYYIAIAIAIHNIPEGLAVALPLRAGGSSIFKCFLMAVITSLPQPIFSIPASLLVWLFEPLMLPLFGFAAGAMMYLVLVELIPEGLKTRTRTEVGWSFMIGFCLMVLVQVLL